MCNGAKTPINQNQALFSLLGTMYGGDGRSFFALPDLRDRVPIHAGNGHTLGEKGGATTSTLSLQQMPMHTHAINASSTDGDTNLPGGNILATAANVYGPPQRAGPRSSREPSRPPAAASRTRTGSRTWG